MMTLATYILSANALSQRRHATHPLATVKMISQTVSIHCQHIHILPSNLLEVKRSAVQNAYAHLLATVKMVSVAMRPLSSNPNATMGLGTAPGVRGAVNLLKETTRESMTCMYVEFEPHSNLRMTESGTGCRRNCSKR